MKEVFKGDICEITWRDHFRYEGQRPPEMVVKTWGKVDEVLPEGIGLILNEVQLPPGEHPLTERIMDGQWILRSCITSIRILRKDP